MEGVILRDDSNFIKLGDFRFTFNSIEYNSPIFYADIGSYTNMLLCDYLGQGNPNDVLEEIKKDIWIDEYNEAISISFEDSVFSFVKLDLPICVFDGQYKKDLKDVDILVRYTDPYTNNIATLTNIKEIESFTKWYQDICKEIKGRKE